MSYNYEDLQDQDDVISPELDGVLSIHINGETYALEGKDFGLEDGWDPTPKGITSGYFSGSVDGLDVTIHINSPDVYNKPCAISVRDVFLDGNSVSVSSDNIDNQLLVKSDF